MAKKNHLEPPEFIVVFDEPDRDRCERVLSDNLHLQSEDQQRHQTIYAGTKKQKRPRLFSRLGVAAVDVPKDRRKALERGGARLFPNLRRHVQVVSRGPLRSFNEEGGIPYPPDGPGSGGALGGGTGPAFPFGDPSDPLGGSTGPAFPFGPRSPMLPSEVLHYLQGQRDLLQLILSRWSTGESGAQGPLPFPREDPECDSTASRLTWCLRLLGIRGGSDEPTGKGVKVAILDTGLDLRHRDFTGRVQSTDDVGREEATAVSFIDGESVQDKNGHGTHCAGVAAGPLRPVTGPRFGVAPECDLLIGKVLDNDGYGYDDGILEGIAWAAEKGARVISLSLGSSRSVGSDHAAAYERVAGTLLTDGPGSALLVAATGNDSSRPHSVAPVGNPAACPSFLAVAAIDRHRHIAGFSNGQRDNIGLVDLCAPGVDVLSSVPGGYAMMSGTSMATPHVAGIAALNFSRDDLSTALEVWWELEQSAIPLGPVGDYGRGLCRLMSSIGMTSRR